MKASGENYLETIYLIIKKQGFCRSIDIVNELGYSKSSVSRAVNLLKEKDIITIDKDGSIGLTEEGERQASYLYEKHSTLTRFFQKIGVSNDIAEEDACKIEHVISDQTFEAIKKIEKKLV